MPPTTPDREVLHQIIEPRFSDCPAVQLTDADVERALVAVYRDRWQSYIFCVTARIYFGE